MPSKRIASCFGEIVTAIELILRWVEEAGGVDVAIHQNLLVRNAIPPAMAAGLERMEQAVGDDCVQCLR